MSPSPPLLLSWLSSNFLPSGVREVTTDVEVDVSQLRTGATGLNGIYWDKNETLFFFTRLFSEAVSQSREKNIKESAEVQKREREREKERTKHRSLLWTLFSELYFCEQKPHFAANAFVWSGYDYGNHLGLSLRVWTPSSVCCSSRSVCRWAQMWGFRKSLYIMLRWAQSAHPLPPLLTLNLCSLCGCGASQRGKKSLHAHHIFH